MALSRSLPKGQAPLACQMCEDTTEIKWKCLTCDFFMCTKCRKIHQKVKSSNKHNIIDIKDIALHQESGSKPDFTNIKCPIHQGQSLCLFCTDCHQGICPTCVAKTHAKHTMIELSDGYNISIEKIKNKDETIDEHTLKLVEGMSTLDLIKSNEKTKHNKENQEILKQEKVLIDVIKRHTHKLLHEIDDKWLKLITRIGYEEVNVSKLLRDLDAEKKVLSNAVNSNDVQEVFRIIQEENCSVSEDLPSVNTKFKQLPVFLPGIIKESGIKTMFGSLEDRAIPLKIELRVVQQYTADFFSVHNIACCNDGSLWIFDFTNDKVQHVTLSDRSIQINREIDLWAADMALTNSGDLLLSTLDPELQIIPHTSGKLRKSRYSVAPLITTAAYMTKDNKIIVGARESGPSHPSDGKYGPRKLIVMNDKGGQEIEHQYDNNNKALFTYPYRITADIDNNIYVIDLLSSDARGRLVVLGQRGGVRGVYGGHPDVNNKDHPFKPEDIKTTESNTTILADMVNHLLHFLDNKGQCLKYYNTKDLGFELPLSLDTDIKGRLYIGCGLYNKGQPEEAKIVVLQLV